MQVLVFDSSQNCFTVNFGSNCYDWLSIGVKHWLLDVGNLKRIERIALGPASIVIINLCNDYPGSIKPIPSQISFFFSDHSLKTGNLWLPLTCFWPFFCIYINFESKLPFVTFPWNIEQFSLKRYWFPVIHFHPISKKKLFMTWFWASVRVNQRFTSMWYKVKMSEKGM